MRRWAWSTRCTSRFRGVSRIILRCPRQTCISLCTRRWLEAPGSPSKFRSKRMKCIVWRNMVSPPTGNIKKPPTAKRLRHRKKKNWHGCVRFWNGSARCRITKNSWTCWKAIWICFPTAYTVLRRPATSRPCLQALHLLILPTTSILQSATRWSVRGSTESLWRSITKSKTATEWKFWLRRIPRDRAVTGLR